MSFRRLHTKITDMRLMNQILISMSYFNHQVEENLIMLTLESAAHQRIECDHEDQNSNAIQWDH